MSGIDLFFWWAGVGVTTCLIVGALILLADSVIERARLLRKGYLNATLFRWGFYVISLRGEENQRFVSNAKLAGYEIWQGKRFAVGIELPAFMWRIVKPNRGKTNAQD